MLGELTDEQLRFDTWERTFAAFEVPDPRLVRWAAQVHHAIELRLYRAVDNLTELLDAARAAGVRTAVVTNGPSDAQREKLQALGLIDRFDAIIVTGDVGAAKPDPRIFEAALSAVSVTPDRAAHVGDTLKADVAGARAAGIRSFWFNPDGKSAGDDATKPDREINSLAEIIPFLARG